MLTPIYDIERMPAQGIFPFLDPSRIPPNGWRTLDNVHLTTGGMVVRGGSTKLGSPVAVYADAIMALAPKLYLQCDETSGTTANDASGNGNHGTISGNVSLNQPGGILYEPGKSFLMSGGSVTVPHHSSIAPTGAMTIGLLVKPTAAAQTILAKGTTFSLAITAASKAQATLRVGSTQTLTGTTTLTLNEWHHILMTYDGATFSLYVDGVLDASQALTGSITTDTADLVIGGAGFTGNVDEVVLCAAGVSPATPENWHGWARKGVTVLGMTLQSIGGSTPHFYTAIFVGNRIRIYKTTLDGVSTEITSTDNGYGIFTRMAQTPRPVRFAVSRIPTTDTTVLLITDGDSAVRFYDGTTMWRHERIIKPRPEPSGHFLKAYDSWRVSHVGGAQHTFTNSSAALVMEDRMLDDTAPPGGQAGQVIKLTIKDNVANGANSRVYMLGGGRLAVNAPPEKSKQVWIVLEAREGGFDWLSSCKIEIADDSGGSPAAWQVVHDPFLASQDTSSRVVPVGSADKYVVLVCSLEHIAGNQRDNLGHMRITWVDSSLTGAGTTNVAVAFIRAIGFGGNVPGQTAYAHSYFSTKMHSVSPPRIHSLPSQTLDDSFIGGAGGIKLPDSMHMYYVSHVQVMTPGQDSKDHKVDTVRIFRRDWNESEFYFVLDSDVSGVGASVPIAIVDNVAREDKNFARIMPSERSHGIPVAAYLETVGARLWACDVRPGADVQPVQSVSKGNPTKLNVSYAGGISKDDRVVLTGFTGDFAVLNGTHRVIDVYEVVTDSTIVLEYDSSGILGTYGGGATVVPERRSGTIMFSRFGNAFEFSPDVLILNSGDVDDDSPGEHVLAGENAKVVLGISQAGVDGITIWTDKAWYMTGGTLTRHILKLQMRGPHGVRGVHSFCQFLHDIFWVDQRQYVRAANMGSGAQGISSHILDGTFDASDGVMAFYRERIYLLAKWLADGRQVLLVFDPRVGGWTRHVYPDAQQPAYIVAGVDASGVERLWAVGRNGYVYRLEDDSLNDDGTGIIVTLEPRRQAPFGLINSGVFMRLLVACWATTGTLTVTKTAYPSGNGVQGRVNLSSASPSVLRYEVHSTAPSIAPAVEGSAFDIRLTGQLAAHTNILAIYGEVDERTRRADTSS